MERWKAQDQGAQKQLFQKVTMIETQEGLKIN